MTDEKSTVAPYLPAEPHFGRFSSQAALGKSVGGSLLKGSDSFAPDWNATLNRGSRRASSVSLPTDPSLRRWCSERWRLALAVTCAATRSSVSLQ
jgi:hypothetical protein